MPSTHAAQKMFDLVVIGGGAAGFFAAIQLAENCPQARIIIAEKTGKVLQKVAISGGGRCNVTHACFEPELMLQNYPRGSRWLKSGMYVFSPKEMVLWLESHGVKLKTEADGRMFPVSDSSASIVNLFSHLVALLGVKLWLNSPAEILGKEQGLWNIRLGESEVQTTHVLLAMGGNALLQAASWIKPLQLATYAPIPSLFTFNLQPHPLKDLMGVSVNPVRVKLAGSKFAFDAPLLITHWGFSGPAVLKLSAFAAEWLYERNYEQVVLVDWLPKITHAEVQQQLNAMAGSKAQLQNTRPFAGIPQRLWVASLLQAGLVPEQSWNGLAGKHLQKLVYVLKESTFQMKGKTTFKDEFVTCGGLDLRQFNPHTCEHKTHQGLYAAGEVLNVDGITGGFNFQAAWTTAYLTARHISQKIKA